MESTPQPTPDLPEVISDIPEWMMAPQADPVTANHPATLREYTNMVYEIALEHVLPLLVSGRTLDSILSEYHSNIEPEKYRAWIYRNPQRMERYQQAMEIGTEAIEEEILRIADASNDNPEDVQRSTLKINTRKWIMQVRNRKRYGDTKSLDVKMTTIQQDHLAALKALMDENVIDVTPTPSMDPTDE